MGRHVITLDHDGLRLDCSRLEAMVHASGFTPDVVLAIATGGVYVADCMFAVLPHVATRLQRPGTQAKNGFVGRVISRMPRFLTDFMRVAESCMLELLPHRKADPAAVDLPDLANYKSILVVDDAIDSGITMAAVLEAVSKRYPAASVHSAVLTITTHRPLVKADYALYDDLTLIRFPWSSDS